MNLFYLDYDTRLKTYFIAPMVQVEGNRWLVEFCDRVSANILLQALLIGSVKTPDLDCVHYKKLREEDGGVCIYKFRGP